MFSLPEREAHHASSVLRVRSGELVTVLDGTGTALRCRVETVRKKHVDVAVIERVRNDPPPFSITLLQALPKGKIIESIIQKATELGVQRIVPLITERVATRLDDDASETKAGKWQHVAVEAIKQCGAPWLPKVEPPVTPIEFIRRAEKFDLPLIASLQPGSRHPREYFDGFMARHHHRPKSVCVWIGPEGDLTPEEVRIIEEAGARPITLGQLVLRVETAAVYCLSILNYELGAPGTEPGA